MKQISGNGYYSYHIVRNSVKGAKVVLTSDFKPNLACFRRVSAVVDALTTGRYAVRVA
jgi:hypothetical protein